MELEILKMLVEKRNKKLSEEFQRNPAYSYLVDARENLEDNEKFLVSYLNMTTNKPISECIEIVKGLNVDNIKFTDSELSLLVNSIVYFKCARTLPQVKDYFLEKNPFKKVKSWNNIPLDKNDKTLVMRVYDMAKKYKFNLETIIKLLEEKPEAFLDICSLAIDLKAKNSDYSVARAKRQVYTRLMNSTENYSIFTRKYKPLRPSVDEVRNKIRKYVESLELEERNYYKSAQLEKYHNESVLQQLENELKKPEITNVRPLIKKISDPKIKEIILLIIYKHNLAYANKLNSEYKKLMSNSKTRYLSLLHEHGITITEDNLGDITHNSIDELTEILNILKTISINTNNLLKIISITDLDIVTEIRDYVLKGYISRSILNDNLEIFNSNKKLLSIIKANIQLFNNYQINPTSFFDLSDILLANPTLLETNLQILESYNLIKALKNSSIYLFLLNDNLASLIDKYLELGYEKVLETDLDILNYPDTRRVEILNNMGIIITKEELIEMFEYNKFFIPDEALDDYIPNRVEIKEEHQISLEELEGYRKTSRTYEINGHLISINKVLRVNQSNINLYKALFTNMNLELDSIKEIESTLVGQTYNK